VTAGSAVDKLAVEYAGKNAVFIEYDVDAAPPSRSSLWWRAHGGGTAALPLVMVDSGNQISSVYLNFYSVYKTIVDTALARPAAAEMRSYWWREDNHISAHVEVTNRSGVTLSPNNEALVHLIIYEDAKVHITSRFGHTAVAQSIATLEPNQNGAFKLETGELSGALNWDRLHAVALVDYHPVSSTGAHDMLQAVEGIRVEAPFQVSPEIVTFMIEPEDINVHKKVLSVLGFDDLTWTTSSNMPWLTVAPASGTLQVRPEINVSISDLAPGWQIGNIHFKTADDLYSDQVVVQVFVGNWEEVYLPLIAR
jgi:hypothetical protein